MNHSKRQDCPEYQKFMANRATEPAYKQSLRQQMLDRIDKDAGQTTAISALAAISHIGRGGSFDSIKDQIKLETTDGRERVRWVQMIAGAMVMIDATQPDSPLAAEMKKLCDYADQAAFG